MALEQNRNRRSAAAGAGQIADFACKLALSEPVTRL